MTRLKPTLLALSASGLLAIAGYEGYSATAYKDTGGISTVGFGHTGPEVKPGTRVTVVQALNTLGKDVGKTERALQSCFGDDVLLTHGEWDAYVALAYNVGAGAVCKSSIRPKLRHRNVSRRRRKKAMRFTQSSRTRSWMRSPRGTRLLLASALCGLTLAGCATNSAPAPKPTRPAVPETVAASASPDASDYSRRVSDWLAKVQSYLAE
nr:MAG TPA: lysozyme [Caudoviricetes sp.]